MGFASCRIKRKYRGAKIRYFSAELRYFTPLLMLTLITRARQIGKKVIGRIAFGSGKADLCISTQKIPTTAVKMVVTGYTTVWISLDPAHAGYGSPCFNRLAACSTFTAEETERQQRDGEDFSYSQT